MLLPVTFNTVPMMVNCSAATADPKARIEIEINSRLMVAASTYDFTAIRVQDEACQITRMGRKPWKPSSRHRQTSQARKSAISTMPSPELRRSKLPHGVDE